MKKIIKLSLVLFLLCSILLTNFTALAAFYTKTISSSSDFTQILNLVKQNDGQDCYNKMYYIFYNSQFAAAYTKTFPYPNSGSLYNYVMDNGTKYTLSGSSKGCYLYADYVSQYVYGISSHSSKCKTNKMNTVAGSLTANQVKSAITTYAQAGEHIRIDNTHSLAFVAYDNNGFYYTDYLSDSSPKIYVHYTTWSNFAAECNAKSKIAMIYEIDFSTNTTNSTSTVTITATPEKNTITDTNAILWARVDKPSNYAVTKIGIKVRKDGSTYESGWSNAWSKNEAPSKNYVNDTYMLPYYNLKDELGLALTHVTKYYYKFYAVVNGTEYWSSEYSFTTTGSHSYGSWSTTKAATCTAAGTQTRKCTGCSKTETKTLSATGHSYGSWTTTKSATCTASGTQTRKCSKCTSTETKTLSALGHNYSSSWTTDTSATCTSAGSKSHHCSRCNAKKDITTISPLSHSWGEWTVSVEATTTSAGKKIRKCTRSGCSATETSTIAILSTDGHTHSFTEWTINTPNTCTTDGVSIRKCTVCDQAETKSITATGHKFSDWVVTKEATVETDGLLERSCSECGEKENDIIPKIISEDNSVYVNNSNEETQQTPEEIKDDNSNLIVIIFIIVAIILIISIAIAIIIKIKKLH